MGEVNDTVKLILMLSISGGLFALALFALKPFMRNRLSKSFQYYIWIVVLLRFMLPFSFGVNLMDFTFNAPNESLTVEETTLPNNNPKNPANINPAITDNTVNNNEPDISERQPSKPVTADGAEPLNILKTLADNLLWIWLAGMLVSLAFNILGYWRFMRYIHGAAVAAPIPDCGAKIFKSRFAPTPMLVGVIRPRIYLPDIEYTDGQLDNILRHELTHLRRRDVWLKWFATLCVSAHWFNPIVYFMRREINRACEMSCDEAVIRDLDGAAKQSYGDTLISVVAESRYPVGVMSTTMCEEKKKLKERLVAIMNYKKKTKIAVLITAVLAVMITGSALAFGAQGSGFAFGKPSVYSVDFPYERASDISAEDMAALILDKINNPKADIYLYSNSHDISLNVDYTLKDFTIRVLISEYKDGALVYRPYQIRIFPDGKNGKMNIFPYDNLADTEQRFCSFGELWNALTYLPVEAIENAIPREAPSFYSFEYSAYDTYQGASPLTNYILFNKDGVFGEYKGTPSVIFIFWAQYQGETNRNSFTGINGADLYYYADRDIKTNNISVDNSYNISLADLRALATKGDELAYEDFKRYGEQDVFTGLYQLSYKVEGGYGLHLVGGDPNDKPVYTALSIPGVEESIDIRYDDIDAFISKYPVPNELAAQIYGYLDIITTSSSAKSVGEYLAEHNAEFKAIVDMGVSALPTLTGILNSGDMSLRGHIALLLVQDIVMYAADESKANNTRSEWLDSVLASANSDIMNWSKNYTPDSDPADITNVDLASAAPEQILFNNTIYLKSPLMLDLDPTGLVKIGEANGIDIFEYGDNVIAFVESGYYLYERQSFAPNGNNNVGVIYLESEPKSNNLTRKYTSQNKTAAIIEYINGLTLKDDFPENPNEYAGVTYIITIVYDDGTQDVFYHFGNMFFGREIDGVVDWKRMEYEEAESISVFFNNPNYLSD